MKTIKKIFSDTSFAYKNLFHWTINKIIINIFSILLWIMLFLPFFIITIIIAYISPIYFWDIINNLLGSNWQFFNILSEFLNHIFWSIFILFLFVNSIVFLLLGMSYSKILFIKLNLSYVEWERLKLKENLYFDKKVFIEYLRIIFRIWLYLLIPILVFIIWIIILVVSFWWIKQVSELFKNSNYNIFAISSFILLISCIFSFIFISYKYYFSIYFLVDKEKSATDCLNKSASKTLKLKNFVKFAWIIGIFILISLPFEILSNFLDNKIKNIDSYLICLKNEGTENTECNSLKILFSWQNEQSLVESLSNIKLIELVYLIFYFIFVYWLFDLMMTSFYKRVINKEE